MSKYLSLAVLIATISLTACNQQNTEKTTLDSEIEKVSYAIGMDIGRSVKQLDTDLDTTALAQGIRDTVDDKEQLLTDQQAQEVIIAFSQKMQEQKNAERDAQANENLAKATTFMQENKDKEGVQTTESGLQYKVLEEGEGPKPGENDEVTVHYRGTTIDGEEFDSSYDRNKPATFPLNQVIPGWTEGLQLMNVGSKYQLFVPPELGYGQDGAGEKIGPNEALIFEVELINVEEKKNQESDS